METSSRFCEVSTYAVVEQSSGYNSSTASSSLNFIDDDHLHVSKSNAADNKNNLDQPTVTKLIITITLLKVEEKVFLRNQLVRINATRKLSLRAAGIAFTPISLETRLVMRFSGSFWESGSVIKLFYCYVRWF